MNFSIGNEGLITTMECTEWCVQQHFANDYAGMWFIFFAILTAFVVLMINVFGNDLIKKSAKPHRMHKHLNNIGNLCSYGTFLFLIAFYVYWRLGL